MRNVKLLPYKIESESAKAIAQELQIGRIKLGQKTKAITKNLVINWGCSSIERSVRHILNKPSAVSIASNKLKTFETLAGSGVSIPEYTTNRDVANDWLDRGFKVVCRHKLNAHNGDGIEIINPESDRLPRAPLYVKYVRKDHEYRVHVFRNEIIDITEKRRRSGSERKAGDELIRNLANGWVFCRDGVYASDHVRAQSVAAVRSLGLDFGAVDVVERQNKAYVLEVNTAPGLVGTTLEKYVDAIREYAEDMPKPNGRPFGNRW